MTTKQPVSISEVLVRGGEILKGMPDFKLTGRDRELEELTTILMKMRKNNLIITGRGGVGITAIVLGIQASKLDLNTPVDIVGKRFYWLNTDKLFECGNSQIINALFDKIRQTLSRHKDTVLVCEDASDFIKAAQNNGCTNLINGLMGDIKSGKYQVILESKDDHLGEVLKCDGDIAECCSLYEVKEPTPENLLKILEQTVHTLERHHGIKVSKQAIQTAATLTEKYKLAELRAQPDAAVSLLDRALTDFRRQAHLSKNSPDWEKQQTQIRSLYKDISDGDEEIRKIEDDIERLREEQIEKAKAVESAAQSAGNQSKDTERLSSLSSMMSKASFDTPQITALKERITKIEGLVKTSSDTYKRTVETLYKDLILDESAVLRAFSTLSGIPVEMLTEDEKRRLSKLDEILAKRVIGQTEPTTEVAKAVKRARLGLKMPNKPSGTFMFLGPSGVGKTELAKALAEALQVPLLRFDMSEYMEKHAVAKLIGAPPGYEGYEQGGILTNSVRKNPYSVVLFDEIEKAHVDVFNVMLQLLDDARLTDSRGLTASFKDTVIIMTTNIGTIHFLDEGIEFTQAKELALTDLRSQYRPEFLGRFGGNIFCFQRLSLEVLTAIAQKDLLRINGLITEKGLSLEMGPDDLSAMIRSKYVAREGARSILGYIDRNITSGIADVVLGGGMKAGVLHARFDSSKQIATLELR